MTGSSNIFKTSQKTLFYLFSSKFGLDHDKATKAQLMAKLKQHNGMTAYTNIQEFFKLAYSTMTTIGSSKTEFCSLAEIGKLSKIGKIIINLNDFCTKK